MCETNRKILLVFLLLGFVSLLADMVYEGARSVSGAFLEYLEAPSIASAVVGSGELLGYILRFVSGLAASYMGSSAVLWSFIIAGYAMNVLALPFLAFATTWSFAVSLYLVERIGKGLRTPARDVALAEVTEDLGRGKGFGIHEVLDQAGALGGPLLVAFMLARYGYPSAFLVLVVPGLAAMILILTAWRLYPRIRSVDTSSREISFRGLGRRFWIYTISMMFQALGFIHWAIVSYFLKYWGVLGDAEIAVLYAIAMGVNALVAFPIGYLYDRIKFRSLYIAPIATMFIPILLVLRTPQLAYVMAAFWGVVMGISETIMRASIADIMSGSKLALAYGVFGLLYGVAWTVGGFIVAPLLEISVESAVLYVVISQIISVAMIFRLNTLSH
ncbi:MAG: MFS transporter [Sulfolobales archaeon]